MNKSRNAQFTAQEELERLRVDNRRLQKMIAVLIERAEKPVDAPNSAFGLFQSTVFLEDQIRSRNVELELALRKNELIGRELHHSKEEIEKSEKLFRNIVEYAPIGMSIIDANYHYTLVNQAFCQILGYEREELYNMTPLDITHPEDKTQSLFHLKQLNENNCDAYQIEKRYIRKDGIVIWVSLTASTVFDSNGVPLLYIGQVEDITNKRQAQEKHRLAAKVFSSSNEAMMITNHDNNIVSINAAFTKLTGYTLDEVIGKNPKLLNSGKHDQIFYAELWRRLQLDGCWEGEIWNRKKDGELYAERLSISAVHDQNGKLQNYVALFSDITEERKKIDQIWTHANYDTVTLLPNRRYLCDRLDKAILQADQSRNSLALMFIDLDHFKEVNDNFGHQIGDQLLVLVGERITAKVRKSDTIARIGGDEFNVIFPEMISHDVIIKIAQELNNALAQPFEIDNSLIQISASIGVAFYPFDAADQAQLIDCADKAMYRSKQQGRNTFNLFAVDNMAD
jgi:diguanylate cyclase (GGDEF)-like protein/PAS domain S-box-containing protein